MWGVIALAAFIVIGLMIRSDEERREDERLKEELKRIARREEERNA